jgi:putative ABC transport system permease protein
VDFKSHIRAAFEAAGASVDVDVLEELAEHAAAAYAKEEARHGTSSAAAVVDTLIAEWVRQARSLRLPQRRAGVPIAPGASAGVASGVVQDVRYGIRLLRREPGASLIAIVTMALAIAATTTLFSVAYGVVLRPLSWPESDRIVRVTETRDGKTGRLRGTVSNGSYLAWSDELGTVEALGGYGLGGSDLVIRIGKDGERIRIRSGRLTPSMFQVLRSVPRRGRLFVPEDARIGTGSFPDPRVMILSYGLWQSAFGGRDDALGTTVYIDDRAPVTIVGIMPPDFESPDRETRAWLPMPIGSVVGDGGATRMMIFGALARLKPGVTVEQAAAEATARARTAPDPGFAAVSMFGSSAPPAIQIAPAIDAITADVKPAITLLLAAVALLFATATANVGSLQLARTTTRRHELAVRAAIGAGRSRLVRQVLVESSLIAVTGGAAGLLLTASVHRLLPYLLPADFPRVDDVRVDGVVLVFALTASLIAALASAVLPAAQMRRIALSAVLADDGATSTAAGWRTPAGRLRLVVMAGQVAATCVLLVGAGLLARSFLALLHADRGYDPVNVLTASVDLTAAYDGARRVEFADAVVARLRAMPGVSDAAAGNALPLAGTGGSFAFEMRTPANPEIRQQVQTYVRLVSPTYFNTMKLRVLEGRALDETDTLTSRAVVVVNRSFARRYLGAAPIGARLPMRFGQSRPEYEVVGVVDDMRQGSVTDPPAAESFVSYRQMPQRMLNSPLFLIVRTERDPIAHAALLRTAALEREPSALIDTAVTMEERVSTSLAKPRFYAILIGALAGFALIIGAVGLFGVVSYGVAQRTRELGVRAALGARRRDIVRLVLRQGLAMTGAGLALGLGIAAFGVEWLSTLLYGVTPFDRATFVSAPLVVLAIAAVACFVPARRAAHIDPLQALKS